MEGSVCHPYAYTVLAHGAWAGEDDRRPPTFIPHGCVKSEEWRAAYQTFFVRSFDKSGMADVILSTFAKFLEAALLVACSPLDPLGGC